MASEHDPGKFCPRTLLTSHYLIILVKMLCHMRAKNGSKRPSVSWRIRACWELPTEMNLLTLRRYVIYQFCHCCQSRIGTQRDAKKTEQGR